MSADFVHIVLTVRLLQLGEGADIKSGARVSGRKKEKKRVGAAHTTLLQHVLCDFVPKGFKHRLSAFIVGTRPIYIYILSFHYTIAHLEICALSIPHWRAQLKICQDRLRRAGLSLPGTLGLAAHRNAHVPKVPT